MADMFEKAKSSRLRQNLEQEQHTLEEVNDAMRERAHAQPHAR